MSFSIWFYGFYGATVIITLWPNNWNNVFEIKGFETCNPHVEPQNVQFGKNDQMQFLKPKIFPWFRNFGKKWSDIVFWSPKFFQNLEFFILNQCWESSGSLVRNDGPGIRILVPILSKNYPKIRVNEIFWTSPDFRSSPGNNHEC